MTQNRQIGVIKKHADGEFKLPFAAHLALRDSRQFAATVRFHAELADVEDLNVLRSLENEVKKLAKYLESRRVDLQSEKLLARA
jgi:hypothetical protein